MVLTALANVSWNSNCSLAKHILKVFWVSWSAILICSYPTKMVREPSSFHGFLQYHHVGLIGVSVFWFLDSLRVILILGVGNCYGRLLKGRNDQLFIAAWKTKIIETSITSEMVSQNTICGEIERPNKDWEFPEIAKRVPWASNKDNEKIRIKVMRE